MATLSEVSPVEVYHDVLLKLEDYHDVNFVITGGTGGPVLSVTKKSASWQLSVFIVFMGRPFNNAQSCNRLTLIEQLVQMLSHSAQSHNIVKQLNITIFSAETNYPGMELSPCLTC